MGKSGWNIFVKRRTVAEEKMTISDCVDVRRTVADTQSPIGAGEQSPGSNATVSLGRTQ